MTPLYELEIAMAQVPLPGQGPAPLPWLVDRLFRNLLTDVTGNTAPLRNLHRQAVLAGRPDRPARAGRVPRLRDAAQRAHEPRAASAGARDHRAAVEEPARRPFRALGHVAARPLHAAALRLGGLHGRAGATLRQNGFAFRPEWFDAQLEFRFPFCGEVDAKASSWN